MANGEKKVMHDVVPKEKRTIRNIRMDTKRNVEKPRSKPDMPPPSPPRDTGSQKTKKNKRWLRWLIILVVIVVVLFVVLSSFLRATVRVTPRQVDTTIDGTFLATATSTFLALPYDVFTLTQEGSETVTATGEKHVEAKASGDIVIFNNFDANNQRLIANTRFETPEGLIYRIADPVTVPGQHLNESGELVPGSVEVTVFADKPGAKYNIDLTDFTIPGFKEDNDPRFDGFFARSKTPMTGGLSGIQKTIAEDDLNAARDTIDANLREALRQTLATDLPDNMVSYDVLQFFTFTDLPQGESEDADSTIFKRQGTLHAIVFDVQDLASFVAENTVATYDGAPVSLANPEDLSFSVSDQINPNVQNSFEFTLSGSPTIVWGFDSERLQNDLAGKSRSDTDMVLSGYPAIEKASISIYPFWRRSFPSDPEKISIETVSVE